MVCKWLNGTKFKLCGAAHGVILVSTSELFEFCESDHYAECPVYKKQLEKGLLLSRKEYELVCLRCRNLPSKNGCRVA